MTLYLSKTQYRAIESNAANAAELSDLGLNMADPASAPPEGYLVVVVVDPVRVAAILSPEDFPNQFQEIPEDTETPTA